MFQIVLGTVTNVDEAVKWLSYTYLHQRLFGNPLAYGINVVDSMVCINSNICCKNFYITISC